VRNGLKHATQAFLDEASKYRTIEERVNWISRMMASGAWISSYTAIVELASVWGVHDAHVRKMSAEAHRRVALGDEERKQLQLTLMGTCLEVLQTARDSKNEVTGLPDFRAILEACEKVALFAGVKLGGAERGSSMPQRIEFSFADKDNETDPAKPPADGGDEGAPAT
jgi:hypothetical protein